MVSTSTKDFDESLISEKSICMCSFLAVIKGQTSLLKNLKNVFKINHYLITCLENNFSYTVIFINYTLQKFVIFFFSKEINTLIQRGHNKLINNDGEDIYNVTKKFNFK